MMSDLDKKLEKVISNHERAMSERAKNTQFTVMQIKQAFTDAGWQSPGGGLRGNSMTGPEWYDRFEKELEKIGAKDNVRSISGAIAKNAAKKAAGLDG